MLIQVHLFALLRERAGCDRFELDLPEGATVDDAMSLLRSRSDPLAEVLGEVEVVMAVNREYAAGDHGLRSGDEVALVPPVSGGAGAVHVRVTEEELSAAVVSDLVTDPAAGAVVTFQGVTREVDELEYEAYVPMAEEGIRSICAAVRERHGAERIAAEHRIGTVALGRPSVVVAVSAAHRPEAFAAAREAIDRIKAEVPIWKREVEGGRSSWVTGAVPAQVWGLVLAAGEGTRFRGTKQLAPFRGRPLIEHSVDAMREALGARTLVVLGHDADRIEKEADLSGVGTAVCARWQEGQSASLQCGVAALESKIGKLDAVVVTLADQPLISSEAIGRVRDRWRPDPESGTRPDVVRAAYEGRLGHPVLLGPRALAAVGELNGDVGARALTERFRSVEVECGDAGSDRDADTAAELKALEAGDEK